MKDFILQNFNKVAHRGLHNAAEGVFENTLLACEKAVEAGVAIEIDLHLTSNNEVVVVHDKIVKTNPTGEGLPRVCELLKLVDGKVPLLLEVKFAYVSRLKRKKYTERFMTALFKELDNYTGVYAIQSFDYYFLAWLKANRPQVARGYLICQLNLNGNLRYFQRIAEPHFIGYDIRCLTPKIYQKYQKQGKPVLTWTISSKELLERSFGMCDGVIFELGGRPTQ